MRLPEPATFPLPNGDRRGRTQCVVGAAAHEGAVADLPMILFAESGPPGIGLCIAMAGERAVAVSLDRQQALELCADIVALLGGGEGQG